MASDDFRIIASNTRLSANLKDVYPKDLDNAFLPGFDFLMSIPKGRVAEGSAIKKGVKLSTLGGFSPNAIGESSDYKRAVTNYNLKDFFQKIRLDYATVKRSDSDPEAFANFMKEAIKDARLDIMANQSRMAFGAGDGLLGTISAVSTTGSVHTCTFSDFNRNFLLKGMNVEVVTSATEHDALFRVTGIDFENSKADLTLVDGSYTPLVNDKVYIQNGYHATNLNEWTGIKKVVQATSGNLYGLAVQDGWQSYALSGASARISMKLLRQCYYDHKSKENTNVDVVVMHPTQIRLLEDQLESQLTDTVLDLKALGSSAGRPVRGLKLGGDVLPIVVEYTMPNNEVWFLNREKMLIERESEGEFIPGTDGMLHYMGLINGRHEWAMLWNQRSELFIEPRHQARLHTLATS